MSLMEKIFGDLNEKEVKKVSKIADKVMAYDEEYQKLTDQELRDKTQEFKKRIQEGETLDALLPEAFAVCREGAWRSLGMKHFYVQAEEIAKTKMPDLNAADLDAATEMIKGTARSMGIVIED